MTLPPGPAASQLTDHSLYRSGHEHELWDRLRASTPVLWVNQSQRQDGYWAVTGYGPGVAALNDWRVFSSACGTILRPTLKEPAPGANSMLTLTDSPRHDAIRNAIRHVFSPRAIAQLEERARNIIRVRLTEVAGAGPFDFVTDLADSLVLTIAGHLLGIPDSDRGLLVSMVKAVERSMRGAQGGAGYVEHLEVVEYFHTLVSLGHADRQDTTVLGALAGAAVREAGVRLDDVVLTCDNIAVAAGESTVQAAAAGVFALIDHPDQWQALKNGDVRVKTAVQEVLRWASPAVHVLRTTTVDTELAGVTIPAGSPVVLWLPSMNRDENEFPRAAEFLLDRAHNRHVAFGVGSHFCLGAALARLVLRVLLEELCEHIGLITLEGRPDRIASYTLGGFDALPISMSVG